MSDLPILRQVQLETWETIQAIAPTMQKARLFGVESPEQAAAIMLKGYELGLGLAASFEFISVIQGKPALSPRGALALIHRSGQLAGMKIVEENDAGNKPCSCHVWMKRVTGQEYEASFTIQDATRAGLVKGGGGWDKYPANMLRWRAIGFCADVLFPDVLGGMKRSDELGADLTPGGETIEGTYSVTRPEPQKAERRPPTESMVVESAAIAEGEEVEKSPELARPPEPEQVAETSGQIATGLQGWPNWNARDQRRFWARAGELDLDSEIVHAAFGVESMKDYEIGNASRAMGLLALLDYGINALGLYVDEIHRGLSVDCLGSLHGLTPKQARARMEAYAEVMHRPTTGDIAQTPMDEEDVPYD